MKLSRKVGVATRQPWVTAPACSALRHSSLENGPVCLYYVIAKAFSFFKVVCIFVKVNQMSYADEFTPSVFQMWLDMIIIWFPLAETATAQIKKKSRSRLWPWSVPIRVTHVVYVSPDDL